MNTLPGFTATSMYPEAGRAGRPPLRGSDRPAHRARDGTRPMKLKSQPRPPKARTTRGRTRAQAAAASRGAGRQARRPGIPFRRRVGARLPSHPSADCRRRRGRHRGGAGGAPERTVDARRPRSAWAGERYTAAERPARHARDAAWREPPGRRHRCAAEGDRAPAVRRARIGHRRDWRASGGDSRRARGRVRVGDPGVALPGRRRWDALRERGGVERARRRGRGPAAHR